MNNFIICMLIGIVLFSCTNASDQAKKRMAELQKLESENSGKMETLTINIDTAVSVFDCGEGLFDWQATVPNLAHPVIFRHFTKEEMEELYHKKVQIHYVTFKKPDGTLSLHVSRLWARRIL